MDSLISHTPTTLLNFCLSTVLKTFAPHQTPTFYPSLPQRQLHTDDGPKLYFVFFFDKVNLWIVCAVQGANKGAPKDLTQMVFHLLGSCCKMAILTTGHHHNLCFLLLFTDSTD